MGMVGLVIRTGQVGMRVDNRIGREMMDVGKGNTSYVVTYEKHYQQVFQYGITE